MGDPKVQRSDSGFFTRLGRAIDAVGGETPKAKSGPSQQQVDAVQPLPKKYKAARRLDRTAISQADPAASKIKQNEGYVANALKLVDDMRALAVKEGAWYNRTTPKDVDKVINKYKPLLLAASGATSLEKSEMRKQLAEMMLKELYETPTADNLFWELAASAPTPVDLTGLYGSAPVMDLVRISEANEWRISTSPYQCRKENRPPKSTSAESCTAGTATICEIGGQQKTKDNRLCVGEKGDGDRDRLIKGADID